MISCDDVIEFITLFWWVQLPTNKMYAIETLSSLVSTNADKDNW